MIFGKTYLVDDFDKIIDIFSIVNKSKDHPLQKTYLVSPNKLLSKYIELSISEKYSISSNNVNLGLDSYINNLCKSITYKCQNLPTLEYNILVGIIFSLVKKYKDSNELSMFSEIFDSKYKNRSGMVMDIAIDIADTFWKYIKYRPLLLYNIENNIEPLDVNSKYYWQFWLWKLISSNETFKKYYNFSSYYYEIIDNLKKSNNVNFTIFLQNESLPISIENVIKTHLITKKAVRFIKLPGKLFNYYNNQNISYKKQEYLDPMLQDQLDILKIIDSNYVDTSRFFVEKVNNTASSLDILHNYYNNCIEQNSSSTLDNSIKLISTKSKNDEIVCLGDYLNDILYKNNNIECKDCLIIVPNIQEYLPYLKNINLRYKYIDLSLTSYSKRDKLLELWLDILDLIKYGESSDKINAVITNSIILDKLEICEDNVRRWLQGLFIYNKQWTVQKMPWYKALGNDSCLFKYTIDFIKTNINKYFKSDRFLDYKVENIYISKDDFSLMSKLLTFFITFESLSENINDFMCINEWFEIFKKFSYTFLPIDKHHELLVMLENMFNIVLYECTDKLSLDDIINLWRNELLKIQTLNQNFNSNKVIVSDLKNARSIPFKVICLIGASHTKFHHGKDLAADLIDDEKLPGDYDKLRYSYASILEYALDAKEYLYISYVNIDEKTSYESAPARGIIELLKPFSNYNLTLDQVFNNNIQIVDSINDLDTYPFIINKLDQINITKQISNNKISLENLTNFYSNSLLYWKKVNGIRIIRNYLLKPTTHAQRDNYLAKIRYSHILILLLNNKLKNLNDKRLLEELKSYGYLPSDHWGEKKFNNELLIIRDRLKSININKFKYVYKYFQLRFGDNYLYGVAPFSKPKGENLYMVPYNLSVKKLFPFWLMHLIQNTKGYQLRSEVYGLLNNICRFDPIDKDQAKEILSILIDIYIYGLKKPIPIYLNSALTFIDSLFGADFDFKNINLENYIMDDCSDIMVKNLSSSWSEFEKTWYGNTHSYGEKSQFGNFGTKVLVDEDMEYIYKLSIKILLPFKKYTHII